jgi:L-iditol 2-dehydrogenase
MADYMCVPWYNLYKLPDGVPLDTAALAEPASIAYCAINSARADRKETILVIGTGAIGLAAVGILKCKGYEKILVAGRQDGKLRIAKDLGASAVINVKKEDFRQRIMEETGGKGVDIVLESSGAADCVEQALDMAADGGRIVLYSFYTQTLNHFPIAKLSSHNISLLGVPIVGGTQKEILRWMAAKELDLSPLITHRFPFEQAADEIGNIDRYGSSRIKILLETER